MGGGAEDDDLKDPTASTLIAPRLDEAELMKLAVAGRRCVGVELECCWMRGVEGGNLGDPREATRELELTTSIPGGGRTPAADLPSLTTEVVLAS